MNARILPLLCDPDTHQALESDVDCFVNPQSGRRYPIRNGIAVFVEEVSGQNRKYQTMYDRLAPGYDFAERIYYWIRRKPSHRLEYISELEMQDRARVLEVSVGTGGNLPFLPKNIEVFGLDLSWGMLQKCNRNLQRWGRQANLFHGEAERLPFREGTFDCVFHVGGINFFNDKARAIREMIRVAKPGTKLMIADETEKVVNQDYTNNPLTRKYYVGQGKLASCPINLVPAEMADVAAREIIAGRMYCLTFRKP